MLLLLMRKASVAPVEMASAWRTHIRITPPSSGVAASLRNSFHTPEIMWMSSSLEEIEYFVRCFAKLLLVDCSASNSVLERSNPAANEI